LRLTHHFAPFSPALEFRAQQRFPKEGVR